MTPAEKDEVADLVVDMLAATTALRGATLGSLMTLEGREAWDRALSASALTKYDVAVALSDGDAGDLFERLLDATHPVQVVAVPHAV